MKIQPIKFSAKRLAPSPELFIVVAIIFMTLWAYWAVQKFDFVNFDDPEYVCDNPHVNSGLSLENAVWAFTKGYSANWHPVTWISHMVDCSVFGLKPGGHHLVSLYIHVANAVLLFFLLLAMTGARWPSALVAALFALHPMHVESVAWVAERKDVLSTFFLFLTVSVYVKYVKNPGLGLYLRVVFWFCIGLMAKPMVVTLPLLLLLLDFWPLRRISVENDGGEHAPFIIKCKSAVIKMRPIFLEKLPLFALSLTSCIVTYLVQKSFKAMPFISYPKKIANAVISYMDYIVAMFFPVNLAFYYPYPQKISISLLIIAAIVFVCISIAAMRAYRKYSWFIVGWLWYVIMLLPVIGIIQVGMQHRADRYSYAPFIGLFIIVAWGAQRLSASFSRLKPAMIASLALCIIVLTLVTKQQVSFWKNSIELNSHALQCTNNNSLAANNLGVALWGKGRVTEAMDYFKKSLQMPSFFKAAEINIGQCYLLQGNVQKAQDYLIEALRRDSTNAELFYCLGAVFKMKGNDSISLRYVNMAIRYDPDSFRAQEANGIMLIEKDSLQKAIGCFENIIKRAPKRWEANYGLALCWSQKGDFQRAFIRFMEAIDLCKDSSFTPYFGLGVLLYKKGKLNSAKMLFSNSIRIAPKSAEAYYNRAAVYGLQNKLDSAVSDYSMALRCKPDLTLAHVRLADIYSRKGLPDSSLTHREKADLLKTAAIDSILPAQPYAAWNPGKLRNDLTFSIK